MTPLRQDPASTAPVIDVGIVVQDAEPMVAFYRDALGLQDLGPLVGGGTTQHRLAWGPAVLKLLAHDTPPSARNPPGGDREALGVRYITFWVEDLTGVVQRCVDGGGHVVVAPVAWSDALAYAFVEDPEGNAVELVENLDRAMALSR